MSALFGAPERIVKIQYCDEDGTPSVSQIQSDWAQSDVEKADFIKNKPLSLSETANAPQNTSTITFQSTDALKRIFAANVVIPSLIAPNTNGIEVKAGKLFTRSVSVHNSLNRPIKLVKDSSDGNFDVFQADIDLLDIVAPQQGSVQNAISVVGEKLYVAQQNGNGSNTFEYIVPCTPGNFFIQINASAENVVATYDVPTAKLFFETSNGVKCKIFNIVITPLSKGAFDTTGSLRLLFQGNLIEHIVPTNNSFNPAFIKFPVPKVLNIAHDTVSENTPYAFDVDGITTSEAWFTGSDNTGIGTVRIIGLDGLNQYSIFLRFSS